MIRKNTLISILGAGLILCGVGIIGAYSYFSYDTEKRIKESIANSVITVKQGTAVIEDSPSTSSSLIDFKSNKRIEVLNKDQEIKGVKTYCNVIDIPRLGIKSYINEGVTKKALAYGVGHHTETALPGTKGNCVIAGHSSSTFKCVFNRLKEIQLLDSFFIYDADGNKHKYYVTDKYVCDPSDTSILYNDSSATTSSTILYTCTNGGRNRLVVVGLELTDEQYAEYKKEFKDIVLRDLLKLNDSFTVEPICTEITSRGQPREKHYSFNYEYSSLSSDKTIKDNLLSCMVGDNAFNKEHKFDRNYSIGYGIRLNGGILNDISKN